MTCDVGRVTFDVCLCDLCVFLVRVTCEVRKCVCRFSLSVCVTFATQVYIEETEGSILEDDLEKER